MFQPGPSEISYRMKIKTLVWMVCMWLSIANADTAQYLYDELGQLVGVANGTGVTAVYTYDAVGNLTSIDRFTPPGSGIGIYLTAPGSGPATTQVTIQGYGFQIPSEPAVTAGR